MSSPPPITDANPSLPLFRPSKKRKIYRSRATADEDLDLSPPRTDEPTQTLPSPPSIPEQTIDELISSVASPPPSTSEQELSIAEILKMRRKGKRTLGGGVEFRVEGEGRREVADDGAGGELAIFDSEKAKEKEKEEGGGGIVRKFAKQTGYTGDVDKHMMAYIDSELAKRSLVSSTSASTFSNMGLLDGGKRISSPFQDDKHERNTWKQTEREIQRQPASLGKLLEIDLGEEVRDRNVKMTEVAWRRTLGEEVSVIEEGGKGGKERKVRLGRDGKPWRGGKRRRGSEDVKRDKAVEEVLRENRLEIYDEPPTPPPATDDGQAADDRIADAFRKEFLDAVSARQRKKPSAYATAPAKSGGGAGGKKDEEVLKGPKLGGSRSARAAMRELLLKEGAKK